MINAITIHRRLFASLLAMWMGLIVISGIVFMHKEVTSDGEIITHIHPYDFTKHKHHHKSDAEIRYLDVVFQGSFTRPTFTTLEIPIRTVYVISEFRPYFNTYSHETSLHTFSRGPPAVA